MEEPNFEDSEKYNFKITICNKEDSKKVQKRLFELGFTWNTGDKKVLYLDMSELGEITGFVVDINSKRFVYCEKNDLSNFREIKYSEVTIKEFCSKKFEKKLNKMLILGRLADKDGS
jgi:hypothetical protein